MNLRLCSLAVPVFAALLAAGNPACASSFQYSSYSLTNPATIHITAPNNVSGKVGQVVLEGASGTPNAGQSLAVFCMDIFTFLKTSGNYQINPLTTAGTGGSNPALSLAQINQIGSVITHGSALIASNSLASAATQLAIWELEYGASFTFDTNSISLSIQNLAALFVQGVKMGTGTYASWFGGTYTLNLLTQANNQSMVYVTPLPGAFMLFATGLAGLALLGRRKRRKDAAAPAAA